MSGKTKDRTEAEKARRAINAATKALQANHGRPTDAPPLVAKKPRRPRAPLITAPTAATLADLGVELVGTNLFIGTLQRTSYGPLRVVEALGQAHPKPQKIESPTRLAIVRCMPCSVCGKGRGFEESLKCVAESGDWKAGAQSEANHHPAKGRGGGGSDALTHPACTACHWLITNRRWEQLHEILMKMPEEICWPILLMKVVDDDSAAAAIGKVLEGGVQRALHAFDLAIAAGKLQTATLVACSVAAFVNAERSQ